MPAGTDLDRLVGDRPTTRRRGRLRRRLRHLRSVREVLLRDLGGLVFEVHRAGNGEDAHRDLIDGKLARMASVDTEIREHEAYLDDHRGLTVREPGIGGECNVCGELFGSDARFCWACGTPVAPGAARPPALERAIVAQLPAAIDSTTADDLAPPPPPPPPPEDDAPTQMMDAVTLPPDVASVYVSDPVTAVDESVGDADAAAEADARTQADDAPAAPAETAEDDAAPSDAPASDGPADGDEAEPPR